MWRQNFENFAITNVFKTKTIFETPKHFEEIGQDPHVTIAAVSFLPDECQGVEFSVDFEHHNLL